MALTVAEQQTAGSNTVAALTFTLGAGSAVGDLLVVIAANDFGTLSTLPSAPTGTAASTWTTRDTFDGGTNLSHVRIFTAPVTTAGAQTVVTTFGSATDEHAAGLWRIPGGVFDVANHANGAAATAHVAPSLTPATSDEIYCVLWTGNNGGNTTYTYTAYPGSPFVQGTERDFAPFTAFGFGYEPITSGVATGTRTATASTSVAWVASAILIKAAPAADSPPPLIVPPPGLFRGPQSFPSPWFGTTSDSTIPQATDTVTTVASNANGAAGVVTPSIPLATNTLGNTTNSSATTASSGNKTAVSKYTAGASGTVTAGHARVWMDAGATTNVAIVIYADSAGVPGALLATSDVINLSSTVVDGLIDFTFSGANQISITNGTAYWVGLSWQDPGTLNFNFSRGATASQRQEASFYLPAPFGTATAQAGPVDAWVDFTSYTPPDSVFDLSNFKLTLPTDADSNGTADEITQPTLATYADSHFYLDASNQMVMTAPEVGATTSGSTSVRSELREMESGAEAAWSMATTAARQLTVTGVFDPTSCTDVKTMIVGQIHGTSGTPPIYLTVDHAVATPRLRLFVNGPGWGDLLTGLTASSQITYRIYIGAGRVKIWAAFGTVSSLPSTPQFDAAASSFTDNTGDYLKVGAYNKSDVANNGTGQSVATISFLELLQNMTATDTVATVASNADGLAGRAVDSGASTVATSVQLGTEGLPGTATTSGASTVTGTPSGARAAAGTATTSGTSTATTTPSGADGLAGTSSTSGTSTLATVAQFGTEGLAGTATATGTSTSTALPQRAAALAGSSTASGASTVTATAALALGGSGTATASTAPPTTVAALPSGADGFGALTATAGTSSVSTLPASGNGGAGSAATSGTSSVTTSPARAGGSGSTVGVSAAATVTAAPAPAIGVGAGTSPTGAASASALPSGAGARALSASVAGAATVPGIPGASLALPGAQAATATTLQAAAPGGTLAGGSVTLTSGSASLSASPTQANGSAGSTTTSGAATITTAATDANGSGPAVTFASATTLVPTTPSGTGGSGRVSTPSGTSTSTSTPSGADGSGVSTSTSGAASVSAAATVALGSGPASTVATATTLVTAAPAGAFSGPVTAGSSSSTTGTAALPGGAVARAGTASTSGTASASATSGGALGGGSLASSLATTVQTAVPAGAQALAGLASLSAAATLQALATGARGAGSTAATVGAVSTSALPGGVRGLGFLAVSAPTVFTAAGLVRASGGNQTLAMQAAPRGSMTAIVRAVPSMAVRTRIAATAGASARASASTNGTPRNAAGMTPANRTGSTMGASSG